MIAMIMMGWARPEPNGNGRARRCDCDDREGGGLGPNPLAMVRQGAAIVMIVNGVG